MPCDKGKLLNRPLCVLKQLFKVMRHSELLELCHSLGLSNIHHNDVHTYDNVSSQVMGQGYRHLIESSSVTECCTEISRPFVDLLL